MASFFSSRVARARESNLQVQQLERPARGEGAPLMEHLFPGDSELAGRMRDLDWASTEMGPPDRWPVNLRTAVSLCLTSRFPILIWWGPNRSILYNDAYIPFLGETKHPRVLGRPGREGWGEIWDTIEPMLDSVYRTGRATWSDHFQFFFDRKLPREEVYVRFTYGPILAEDGRSVQGVFCPCTETTDEVIGARRLETLRRLGAEAAQTGTVDAACHETAAVLADNPYDIPCAALYLMDDEARGAVLKSVTGFAPDGHPFPLRVSRPDEDMSAWPVTAVLRTGRSADVSELPGHGTAVGRAWPDPVLRGLVLPIFGAAREKLAGLAAFGVSPRRVLDDSYRTFCHLVAGQIGIAIAGAQAHETERRRAEALLEIDGAKTVFFSNVSHEFRTPLTLMLGPIDDILGQEGDSLAVSRAELDLVRRNARRMLRLVNTLLYFSRIEAGRARAVFEPTDLPSFTDELAAVFRSAFGRAKLGFVVDCPPLEEPVFVDPDMWEKIVLNLLSNALKFTIEGEVTVAVDKVERNVRLTVRDTGTGIPEDSLPHLFDRFHRIEGARGRTHEGSGIGLAMVRELVKLHGGSVRVESQLGRGSTFTVSLPLGKGHLPAEQVREALARPFITAAADVYVEETLHWDPVPRSGEAGAIASTNVRAATVLEEAAATAPGTRARILLADDNADMRDYVQRLLGSTYEVEAVGDGEAAFAAALRAPPDLVLADVMMPRMDGLALLKALRADPRTRTVPVVLLSARAGEESGVQALASGADDYLIKPFSARELLARIDARVELERLRREAFERDRELRRSVEETEDLIRLHEFTTRLVGIQELQPLLDEVLRATIAIQNADFGNVQLYDAEDDALEIVAHHGFRQDFLDYFSRVDDAGSACGRALEQGQRVIIEDVERDPAFAPHRAIGASAGFRAVQSTPLSGRTGTPLGMLSTHFRRPHRPSERELRLTDLYARWAAEVIEQKRAEEALRTSEERFRRYFDLGLIGMATTSTTKGILEVNDELCRILGYERDEILKRTWAEMTHPDDLAADVTQFERVLGGAIDGYTLEKRWIRGDGRVIHSIMAANCLRRPDGSVEYFVGLVLDTTEQREAEERLRRDEAYLAEAQKLSHTGSWAWNVQSGELFWSRGHFLICGLDPDQTTPSYEMFLQLVHPEDRHRVQRGFEEAVQERRDFERRYRVVRPDGDVRYIHSLAHPSSATGAVTEYVGTVIDTTEAQIAENKIQRALEEIKALRDRLAQEKLYLEEEIRTEKGFEEIVGESAKLKRILKLVKTVAPTDATVLIQGETGTGKELVARAIHRLSRRGDRTFVKINCAAIPTGLLESELFGHERGAFTGAVAQRMGRFELADQGTIFLDEVGEIPLELQAKLLRVLQEREFERVGSTRTIRVDVRLIAATNRDLKQQVGDGYFREDLFYRLNVFPVLIPPLRDRPEDIPALVLHFTRRHASQMNKSITRVPPEIMQALRRHSWPGNIRELENLVERSVILSRGSTLEVPLPELGASDRSASGGGSLEDVQRDHILRVLEECGWVIAGPSGAAARLGMKRSSLQYRMKKLGIRRPG
jgi:PAS domain S-box-containing protein